MPQTEDSQFAESGVSGRELDVQSLVGYWAGDPSRIGMQFESIQFGATGALEANIVTMCVRGFCPSVQSFGTFSLPSNERILLTLDGIGQEFIAWMSDGRLYLRDPISGMTKSYFRSFDEPERGF